MRVLHVVPSLSARDGGPSRVAVGLCRALEVRGLSTTIATTVTEEDPLPQLNGLAHVAFPRRGERFKFSSGLSRWLRQSTQDFDVVHIHAVFSHSSLAAGKAARSSHTPYVLRPLGSLDPWALSRRRWQKRMLRPAVDALISGAAAIHFMTAGEARLATPAIGAARAEVIPPGIDDEWLSRSASPQSKREQVILAIGRLHPVKRLDALIAAFHRIAGDPGSHQWRLVIAGDGDATYRAELERAAAAGPAAPRILFTGWLDEAGKSQWLQRASLVAVPSFQENFGLGLVEAMASGIPAVVSRGVNLSPEIEDAGAGWVFGESDAELAATLLAAMSDESGWQHRAASAKALASSFTWSSAAEAVEQLYLSVRQAGVGGRL